MLSFAAHHVARIDRNNLKTRNPMSQINVVTNETTAVERVTYNSIEVDGLNIAYREAGNPANPKLVLLHGFPASSHQYRDLVRVLADRFHVVAPDYPGFGNSDPAEFPYTFDKTSEIIEDFLKLKGFDHYGLFVQDYRGPVGFRIVGRHPGALEWLIILPVPMRSGSPQPGMASEERCGKTGHRKPKSP